METRSERAFCWWMDHTVMLPMIVTVDSPHRAVRIFGVVWFLLWFVPAGAFFALTALPFGFVMLFESAWRGD